MPAVLITAMVLLAPAGPFATTFTPLGPLIPGVADHYAYGISANGMTVVGYSSATPFGERGLVWHGGVSGALLDDLPGGGNFSGGAGVSGDGLVVVGSAGSTSGPEATRWVGTTPTGLGDLAGGGFESRAYGASADGSVIVGVGTSAAGYEAFRWTAGGGMAGLGDLADGGFYSQAYAVSSDGTVIVGQSTSASGLEAFRWTQGGGMVGLGDLAGDIFRSFAVGVSADGSTIVGAGSTVDGQQAFRWTAGSGMVALGNFGNSSLAHAVSGDGAIVVGTALAIGNAETAFIWTEAGGMQRLFDVLVEGGVDLTGWYLAQASGISADGTTIAGWGFHNNVREAFVAQLTPVPVPAAWVYLVSAVASLARFRRKRTPGASAG